MKKNSKGDRPMEKWRLNLITWVRHKQRMSQGTVDENNHFRGIDYGMLMFLQGFIAAASFRLVRGKDV